MAESMYLIVGGGMTAAAAVRKVDEARKLIAESGPFRAEDLKGRIRGES